MEALPLVTFYIGPPPQPATPRRGPLGPPWKLPRTIFILHLRRSIWTTCITLLFYFKWIWRRSLKFAKFWPLGPSPWAPHGGHLHHMNTFESPAPWGWFLPSLVKIQPCISSSSYSLYRAPLPNLLPTWGAIGATLESATNNLYSSPKLHFTQLDYRFYLNWIWRKKFENLQSFGPWGPPLGPPHRSHMYHMKQLWIPGP